MRLIRAPFRLLKTCTVAPELISGLSQWENLAKLMFCSFQDLFQLSRTTQALNQSSIYFSVSVLLYNGREYRDKKPLI